MSKVIKVIFTLFNLQGTLPVARGDLNILAHLPPFVKHFFQISCFFVFTQKLRKTNRFLTNFIGLCVHLLPALSSAWIYYHTQPQMSTPFFHFFKIFFEGAAEHFFQRSSPAQTLYPASRSRGRYGLSTLLCKNKGGS